MPTQVTIAAQHTAESETFQVLIETPAGYEPLDNTFASFQSALDYVLAQGWQLARPAPESLHVETRFLKP